MVKKTFKKSLTKIELENRRANRREHYKNNKESYIKNAREWDERNPRKVKIMRKKGVLKFQKENPERFKELMRLNYQRNKEKQKSRVYVYKVLRVYKNKKYKLNKSCAICGSYYRPWLFYNIYPLTYENIIKALKQRKIKYLCRKHWNIENKKRIIKNEKKKENPNLSKIKRLKNIIKKAEKMKK